MECTTYLGLRGSVARQLVTRFFGLTTPGTADWGTPGGKIERSHSQDHGILPIPSTLPSHSLARADFCKDPGKQVRLQVHTGGIGLHGHDV